jgi:hypothetical protein
LVSISAALQRNPAINPHSQGQLVRSHVLAVISTPDQAPQFLPSFADRTVKALGEAFAIDAPA